MLLRLFSSDPVATDHGWTSALVLVDTEFLVENGSDPGFHKGYDAGLTFPTVFVLTEPTIKSVWIPDRLIGITSTGSCELSWYFFLQLTIRFLKKNQHSPQSNLSILVCPYMIFSPRLMAILSLNHVLLGMANHRLSIRGTIPQASQQVNPYVV